MRSAAHSFFFVAFNLDFYLDPDPNQLLVLLNQEQDAPSMTRNPRYRQLNEALCSLIEDFAYLSFYPLAVNDPHLLANVVRAVDRASGYIFHGDISEVIVRDGALEDHSAAQDRYFAAPQTTNTGEAVKPSHVSVLSNVVERETEFII